MAPSWSIVNSREQPPGSIADLATQATCNIEATLLYCTDDTATEQLLTSPGRGNSFEGIMIQQIAALEELQRSGSAFYFYRTHSGAEIDLLIDRGNHRVGFEFKAGIATDADDWKHLQSGIDDDVIQRGYVVYNGTREFPVSDKISVVPATQILSGRLQ